MNRAALSALRRVHAATLEIQTSAQDGLLDFIRWTPPQELFHRMQSKRRLFRSGNQIGKSTCGLAQVIWACLGSDVYYQRRPPPIEAWIVCTSWSQSVAIMRKFYELCPKSLLTPRSRDSFSPRRGFGKDNPAVVFMNGSIVRFRTTNQGPEALAGATIDFCLIDEPCDEEIYRELDRRLLRRSGDLIICATPINRPTEWLKELVDAQIVDEVHARMIPENFIPVGSTRPLCLVGGIPMDAAWIAEQERTTMDRYSPVLLHGEWETRSGSPIFHSFDPQVHVTKVIPKNDVKISIGFDHGSGRNWKNIGVLIAVDSRGEFPRLHILDECPSDGDTTPDQDAAAALRMLRRNGLKWKDLDRVYGDKEYGGRGDGLGRKSNRELTKAIQRMTHVKAGTPLVPSIRQAKTGKKGGRGSVYRGCEWIHRAMLRESHFTVHPRCQRVIFSLESFQFKDDDSKDAIDAIRYASWNHAMRGDRNTGRGMYVY